MKKAKRKKQQQSQPESESKFASEWEKIRSEKGLYRFRANGVFFANFRRGGKHFRESLHVTDLSLAKRKLAALKSRIVTGNDESRLTWPARVRSSDFVRHFGPHYTLLFISKPTPKRVAFVPSFANPHER